MGKFSCYVLERVRLWTLEQLTRPDVTRPVKSAPPSLRCYNRPALSLRPGVDAERSTPAALLSEMSRYPGHVVVGRDLDVY